jgi:hypothetical protein
MMLQALGLGLLPPPLSSSSSSAPHFPQISAFFDPDLSSRWAGMLAERVKRAEAERNQDRGVRPMPYSLEPEPWTRRRPASMVPAAAETPSSSSGSELASPDKNPTRRGSPSAEEEPAGAAEGSMAAAAPGRSWLVCGHGGSPDGAGAPPGSRALVDAAVVQAVHTSTGLHVGCGAKFGCDYLLYEGPRRDHHAFAGLRVVPPGAPPPPGAAPLQLPLPDPCDLAGYVRGLNTAGKLALLATAVPGGEGGAAACRVAVVDLALKKVRATAFRGASGTVTPKGLPKRPPGSHSTIA